MTFLGERRKLGGEAIGIWGSDNCEQGLVIRVTDRRAGGNTLLMHSV